MPAPSGRRICSLAGDAAATLVTPHAAAALLRAWPDDGYISQNPEIDSMPRMEEGPQVSVPALVMRPAASLGGAPTREGLAPPGPSGKAA
jgi:hypothetical protein